MHRALILKKSILTVMIINTLIVNNSLANENTSSVGEITVLGFENKIDSRKVTKDSDELTKELINDEYDLLKNIPGVSVNSGGRSGSNGYAIRGVETDRVAITVDGIAQADSFIPGVYSGYGYMNGNRNTTELENISSVAISKGADSFGVGSGGIGGAVEFRTKVAEDFILPGKNIGLYNKLSYGSKNEEFVKVFGMGFKDNGLKGLFQIVKRDGHETKTFSKGEDIYGSARQISEPSTKESTSILTKLGYCFNDEHCVDSFFENRKMKINTEEKSYETFGDEHRFAKDMSPYERYGFSYMYMPINSFIDTLKFKYSKQNIEQHAITKKYEKNNKVLTQTNDRNTFQNIRSVSLNSSFVPIETNFGDHYINLSSAYTTTEFKNINRDLMFDKGKINWKRNFSIIKPVDSKMFHIKIKDSYKYDNFTWDVGFRYDIYQHKPLKDPMISNNNTKYESEIKKFAAPTWFSRLNYQFSDEIALEYKISKGFRAPKALELYFEYTAGDNFMDPNPDLKSEYSINQEIALKFDGRLGQGVLSGFYTKYKDFIEERNYSILVENPWFKDYHHGEEYMPEYHFVSDNIDEAKIYGLEFSGYLDLHEAFDFNEGFYSKLLATYTKGSKSTGDDMRAIQPFNVLGGIGFDSSNYGFYFSTNYMAAKNKKDTQETLYTWRGEVKRYSKYTNKAAFVSDLRGYWNINKYLSLGFGINNIFNKKYFTWNDLRSIPTFGTTNMVDYKGLGVERFSSPGRNYSLNFKIKY